MLSFDIGLLAITLFLFGAIIGSFLHVVAERYGTGESIVGNKGRGSVCPHCKKNLSARELVPIFSYILQRARCASCKQEIPFHYPVLELLSGLVTVLLLMPPVQGQADGAAAGILLFAAYVLLVLIRIDAKSMILPDGYIAILGGAALLYAYRSGSTVQEAFVGALAGALPLYALWIATSGKGIGFGDVKLMIPLGIAFGFRGAITLLFFAVCAGGMVGIFLLASKKAGPKTAIPFGPFLAGAALVLMVFPTISDRFFAFLGV